MTTLCLGCGHQVRLNKDCEWETQNGDTACTGGGPHRVQQVVPDAETIRTGARW